MRTAAAYVGFLPSPARQAPGAGGQDCIEGPTAALSDAMSPKVVDVRSETAVPPRVALTG
ncbi:hypothetical protein O1157_28320 [Streptomyces albogriseolus]